MGSDGKTGEKISATRLRVLLREYEDPGEQVDKGSVFGELFMRSGLLDYSEEGEAAADMSHKKVEVDKWIYVFRHEESGWVIHRELSPTKDQQHFIQVDWRGMSKAERDEIGKQDPRPHSKNVDRLYLDAQYEHRIVLTQDPLSYSRIEYYSAHPGALEFRGVHLPKGASPNVEGATGDKGAFLYLVDHLAFADALHERYMQALEQQMNALTDSKETKKRYLADMVWALHQKKSLDIDGAALEAYRKEQSETLEEHFEEVAKAAFFKFRWLGVIDASRMPFDYDKSEETQRKIESRMATYLQGSLNHALGLGYLARAAQDENSWLYRYTVGEAFTTWRKTTAAVNDWCEVLAHYLAGRISEVKGEIAAQTVTKELNRIFNKAAIRNIQTFEFRRTADGLFFVDESGYIEEIGYQLKNDLRSSEKHVSLQKWKKKLEQVGGPTQKVLFGIELVNLMFSWQAYRDKLSHRRDDVELYQSGLELAGGAADAFTAAEFLLQNFIKERVFLRVGVFGAVCDYIIGVKETYDSMMDGKTGLALSWATTALGATALGAAGSLKLGAAAGGAGTAFGLSAAALTGIGAVLVLGGVVAVLLLSESEIEEWAGTCVWGEDFRETATEAELAEQIRGLHEIVAAFNVRCEVLEYVPAQAVAPGSSFKAEYAVRFRIIPGLYYPSKSKFRVRKLEIGQNTIDRFEIEGAENRTFSDGSELHVHQSDDRVHRIERVWGLKRKWTADYSYTVKLDLHGDGREVYTKRGEGQTEVVSR